MYHERQRGGACRMHSLNNWMGREWYNDHTFNELMTEYVTKYPWNPPIQEFDSINTNLQTLISHALRRFSYGAITYMKRSPWETLCIGIDMDDLLTYVDERGIFVFSPSHIWSIRRDNEGRWCNFDSMIPTPTPIPDILGYLRTLPDDHGITFPIPQSQCPSIVELIQRAIRLKLSGSFVASTLLKSVNNKDLIGWLETPVCIAYSLLYICNPTPIVVDFIEHWIPDFINDPGDLALILYRFRDFVERLLEIK
jgi:hypothetical protein